jgi:branched-chain amino acid transport system permease protein
MRILRRRSVFCLILGILLLMPIVLSSYHLSLLTQALVFGLFAMSLDLLVGTAGLPSLGHAAFFGAGAYTAGLISLQMTNNFWICLLAGVVSGLMISGLFGFLAIRAGGSSFLMITLALGQVLWAVAYKWRSLTGGDDGLTGISLPTLGLSWGVTRMSYYYLVLAIVALMSLLLSIIARSPFGLTLKGIRDGELRMTALGYNVSLYKYTAFIIAAGFASTAGVLYVFYNRFVGPSDLGLVLSAKGLLMVILGGAGTLWGAAFGAALVTLMENLISTYTDRWVLVLGAVYVVVIMFFPKGILGPLRREMQRK